jgi:NADPH2:quinone reductase
MKAARFHKTGGPEVLIYEDVPDPVPGPGQILLKVEAAGVNYVDIMRRPKQDRFRLALQS